MEALDIFLRSVIISNLIQESRMLEIMEALDIFLRSVIMPNLMQESRIIIMTL